MKDIDLLQGYTDAARESSTRTRQILLVMIIASILMFAAFWNSRAEGWVNSRLAFTKATFDILENEKAQKDNPRVAELRVPPGQEDLYQRAMEHAHSRSLEQAKANLLWVQRIRAEQLSQIQVPVLGISFDVNDLAMLGGFTFIVLLIWVNYSLWHHSTNLELALDFAKELEAKGEPRLLYFTYQNLAMRQVLTIPPRPASTRTSETDKLKDWVRKVSKLLYALPLAVQTTVLLHDWNTHKIGWEVNPQGTIIVLATGTFFWCIIAILTVLCFLRWRRTYDTWKTVADKI